jgi:hypothetical protein
MTSGAVEAVVMTAVAIHVHPFMTLTASSQATSVIVSAHDGRIAHHHVTEILQKQRHDVCLL